MATEDSGTDELDALVRAEVEDVQAIYDVVVGSGVHDDTTTARVYERRRDATAGFISGG